MSELCDNVPVYFRRDIQVEPLVDSWYAWPHLIPPATYARNLTERHARIMQSYIASPQIHANAVKNPKLLGGPFIDYSGCRSEEIKQLLKLTMSNRADLVRLSTALSDLDRMLETKATGHSLHDLYASVPTELQGYVELVYDRNNHPSYRLIEPLLYRSKYYNTQSQTIALSVTKGDDRPFILSTPRLPEPNVLHLKLPFAHGDIDYLFALKHRLQPFGQIRERFAVPSENETVFRSFFTEVEPKTYSPYDGVGIRWRYFGHACILLETQRLTVMFDPVLSYTYDSRISRYTYDDLPDRIDFVIITHNHQDHVLIETLLQLRQAIDCIIVPRCGAGPLQDPSLKLTLEAVGFKNVIELDEMQTLKIEGGSITGLPFMGEHADLNIRSKLTYLLDVNGQKLMFAADSCNIEPLVYRHIQREVGAVRALFVGMECDGAPLSWLYGPLLTQRLERGEDESRRLSGSNCAQVMELVDTFKCRELFVYAMGQEPWLNYIMSLKYTPESNPIIQSDKVISICRERGIVAERLFGERELYCQ